MRERIIYGWKPIYVRTYASTIISYGTAINIKHEKNPNIGVYLKEKETVERDDDDKANIICENDGRDEAKSGLTQTKCVLHFGCDCK